MVRTCLFVLLLGGCTAPMGAYEASLEEEVKAYHSMLNAKLERGELSEEEARYLATQKQNEIMERYRNEQRARNPGPVLPRATRCTPDGYGGMRCR